MIIYFVKFTLNKSTKNQNLDISHCMEQRHKESDMRYFTLSLNKYILCEICYERRHKESKFIYFTLSLTSIGEYISG